jgi:hypothetical protein
LPAFVSQGFKCRTVHFGADLIEQACGKLEVLTPSCVRDCRTPALGSPQQPNHEFRLASGQRQGSHSIGYGSHTAPVVEGIESGQSIQQQRGSDGIITAVDCKLATVG